MDVVSYLRLASGLVNAEGRQRALHYRSAWLGPLRPLRGSRFALRQPDAFGAGESRAFTTALHETSNGVLAGGNFLQMKTTQRKGDRKAVEESRS